MEDESEDARIESIPFNLNNCDLILGIALQDFAGVQNLLPPGYRAEDASVFFNSPLAFDQTAVVAVIMDCQSFELAVPIRLAAGWVLVEAPDIAESPTGSALNFYQLFGATDEPLANEYLAKIGWVAEKATIGFSRADVGQNSFASVTDSDIGLTLFALRTGAETPLDNPRSFRIWQNNAIGTQLLQLEENSPGELSRGGCIVEPGSRSDELFNGACDDLGQSLLYFPLVDASFPGTATVFPWRPL